MQKNNRYHTPTNNIAKTGALKILIPSIPVKVHTANNANELALLKR
jgi:hypothetical protein